MHQSQCSDHLVPMHQPFSHKAPAWKQGGHNAPLLVGMPTLLIMNWQFSVNK